MGPMGRMTGLPRTAESVSMGHPDKFMDRVADAILDAIIQDDFTQPLNYCRRMGCRVAVEGCVKDNLIALTGEISASKMPDLKSIARKVWQTSGYGPPMELALLNYVERQSPELSSSSAVGGAGDQGIMVGYASDETEERLPKEFVLARRLRDQLLACRENGSLPWVRTDIKTQVTLDANGHVVSAVIATQHEDRPELILEREEDGIPIKRFAESARNEIVERVLRPVLSDYFGDREPDYTVNGAGSFVIGGPRADAGEVGRKIVVDAYGPRIPVGGGAYSGKDPTKVDRSAAYMARFVAKTIVDRGMAQECLVTIAYAIGKTEPEMVTAVTEKGEDLGAWARSNFDFSPWAIIERLQLWKPQGWSYEETAAHGHYGYPQYPWEQTA